MTNSGEYFFLSISDLILEIFLKKNVNKKTFVELGKNGFG